MSCNTLFFDEMVHLIRVVKFMCVRLFVAFPSLIILLMSVGSVWYPISFLILEVCFFFPLSVLLENCQFYQYFQKPTLLFHWLLKKIIFVFNFIDFSSHLYYFLPSLCCGFILFYLLGSSGQSVDWPEILPLSNEQLVL